MPSWDASQYLQFADQRTRPCCELVERVEISSPSRVIDLGCGPGNSTAVVAERWPTADITGLDNSSEMIEAARRDSPDRRWIVGHIAQWARDNFTPFDVIISNAAMQWVDDHPAVFPLLMRQVAPGGALAVQMPGNYDAPAHTAMRHLAAMPKWHDRFPAGVREWHVEDLPFYYDLLAPHAGRLDLWETEYYHVMPAVEAIVEWYKGTGLRPFLDALSTDADRAAFTAEYVEKIRETYPRRADEKVLFPFRRLFIVAYR
jgi:trans-aconitate 2-methyltransferase